MADRTPVLDLTTVTERLLIRIDAIPYALKRVDDLTLAEYYAVERILTPLHVLIEKSRTQSLAPPEDAQLTTHLDELVAIALLAPADVRQRLGQLQKMRITDFFSGLLSRSLGGAEATGAHELATAAAGTTSSPASPGSTAASATTPGTRKSRSGRSARTSR